MHGICVYAYVRVCKEPHRKTLTDNEMLACLANIYTHIRTCTHAYIHACMHTYIQGRAWKEPHCKLVAGVYTYIHTHVHTYRDALGKNGYIGHVAILLQELITKRIIHEWFPINHDPYSQCLLYTGKSNNLCVNVCECVYVCVCVGRYVHTYDPYSQYLLYTGKSNNLFVNVCDCIYVCVCR